MTTPAVAALWILGAGGHGKVVADSARASGRYAAIAFFDDALAAGDAAAGWSIAGGTQAFMGEAPARTERFVAIGDNARRDALLQQCSVRGLPLATVVHPAASVSPGAHVAEGTLVAAGAVVAIGAQIGPGGIVNHGASVDHDCRLGRAVHVGPGARLGGGVVVADRGWVGIGAVVRHLTHIGRDAVVGAGAVVVASVPDNTTVVGNPARRMSTRRDA